MVERTTQETTIRVEATLGTGRAEVDTTVPFLDHMLTALARYSGLDLGSQARGDLRHHIIEDVALTLGAADRARDPGDRGALRRAHRADGRRAGAGGARRRAAGRTTRPHPELALRSLHALVLRRAVPSRCTSACCAATDRHHVVEAAFKALGFALRQAVADAGRCSAPRAPCDWRPDDARATPHRLPRRAGWPRGEGGAVRGPARRRRPGGARDAVRGGGRRRDRLPRHLGDARGARTLLDLARRTAERLFIPLTIGGGIRTVDDIAGALRAGADKVSLNSAAVRRPELLTEGAARFGAQCIVASIDAALGRRALPGLHRPAVACRPGLEAVAWAERVRGARGGRDPAHEHRPRRRP